MSRCYRLVGALLSGKELDRRTAAKLIGVNVAAADRHLDAIVELLPGVVERKHRHQRILRLNLDAVSGAPSRSMAVAACFGASLAHLFRGSAYEAQLTAALEHVLGRVRRGAEFMEARRKFVFVSRGGEMALPDKQGILDDLVEAVLRQERIALKYENFEGKVTAVEISPWSIVIYGHQIYVIAEGTGSAHDVYRLSRIRSASRRTTKTFEYPSTAVYEPEVVFRDAFGIFLRSDKPVEDVVLRLNPHWRTYARTHRWHPSQTIEVHKNNLQVRMRVRVCPELETFVLGFCDDAEVIAPAALRERIAARAAAFANVYRPSARSLSRSRRHGGRARSR